MQMLNPQDTALKYTITQVTILNYTDAQSFRHNFISIYYPSYQIREIQIFNFKTLGYYLFFLV